MGDPATKSRFHVGPRPHRVIAPDGASLYWEEEGAGPRVLLVHGGTGTGAFDWEHVRGPLARDHRLLVADLRGHGRSSDPHGALGLSQIGEDTEALLHAAGGADAIVAFSIGASAMLALLARRPMLTRAFVAIAGSTDGDTAQAERFATGPWPAELVALRHEHGADDDHWRRLRRAMALSWGQHHVPEPALTGLRLPTLVVCGDRDRVEPPETALRLTRLLPRGELLVIPSCGHFVARERPEPLVREVRAFLDRTLRDDAR